ncbi:MAG: hypothetical protein AAGF11_47565 [Myxococcota bacterium]
MAVFDLIMDEFGTISSDSDDVPYGYGYCLAERGTDADNLRTTLSNKFPNGLHFKNIRRKRKISKVNEVVPLLSTGDRIWFGAHVCTDPSYGRDKYFRALSGQLSNSDTPSTSMMDKISKAPLSQGGLVDPTDILPDVKGVARLLSTYSPLIRFPVLGLLKSDDAPGSIEIHVHIGEVGRSQKFQKQLKLIANKLTQNWETSFNEYVKAGLIEPRQCNLTIEVTQADVDPLFSLADMFAHVAHHYFKDLDADSGLGKDLYNAVKPVLINELWLPEKASLVAGISHYPPLS